MALFKKDNMGPYKPVPVIILPPVTFIGGPTMHGRTVRIQVSWDPEISKSVITTIGIPVEEALTCIGMKTRNAVIHMESDGESSWVNSLG